LQFLFVSYSVVWLGFSLASIGILIWMEVLLWITNPSISILIRDYFLFGFRFVLGMPSVMFFVARPPRWFWSMCWNVHTSKFYFLSMYISVVKKMDSRIKTPPRSAIGECGFCGREPVERIGSIAGQSGRYSLKTIF